MTAPACDCYLLCGEPSGDGYAAAIIKRLRRLRPGLVCRGIGGPAMEAAGIPLDERMDGRALMGLFPVLVRLPEFIALGKRVEASIRTCRPRLLVSIDYPGFNLRMQRRLADLDGCRRIHVVAPQVWAWRPRRAKTYARSVDELHCFFPFEPPLFARFGCRARFVGHPMVDIVASEPTVPRERLLLLAPGGRRREVELLLGDFDLAARILLRRLVERGEEPPAVCIAGADGVDDGVYRRRSGWPVVRGDYRRLCRRARVAAIASGTATLEAALVGLPHVIAYRMDPVSFRIASHLVTSSWVGLPNIIHGRTVAPELLQERCTPARLAGELLRCWDETGQRHNALAGTAGLLGGGGALDRVAAALDGALVRG